MRKSWVTVIWEAVWHSAKNASTDGGGILPTPWGWSVFFFLYKNTCHLKIITQNAANEIVSLHISHWWFFKDDTNSFVPYTIWSFNTVTYYWEFFASALMTMIFYCMAWMSYKSIKPSYYIGSLLLVLGMPQMPPTSLRILTRNPRVTVTCPLFTEVKWSTCPELHYSRDSVL